MSNHGRTLICHRKNSRGDDLLGIEQVNLTTSADNTLVKTDNGYRQTASASVLSAAAFYEISDCMLNLSDFVTVAE